MTKTLIAFASRAKAANALWPAVSMQRRARAGFAGVKNALRFRPAGLYCNAAKKLPSRAQVLAAQHDKIFAPELANKPKLSVLAPGMLATAKL